VHKFIPTLTIAGLLALSLVACSSPGASDCAATPSGSHSSSIKVSGEAGAEPTVEMPPPFDAAETERTVITTGAGKTAEDGQVAVVNYVAYNASTGGRVEATEYPAEGYTPFLIDEAKSFPGIYKALHCSVEGDRVVAVIPPSDLFGSTGLPDSNGGYTIGPTDTTVFVFDIRKVEPAPTASPSATPEPLPTPAEWTTDVPKVDLKGATPVVTLPKTDPPAELLLKVLKEGDGEVVTESSTVTLDYQLVLWSTGEVKEQSFGTGQPLTLGATGFVPGFSAAIIGQKVGSTVVVTIPPQYAYGLDPSAHELGGQTLLFVVAIQGVS
jgi:peptidylprolyl isomerase